VEITWLGHSCFRLKGRDSTIVTDPFGKELGYPLPKLAPDVVTISHDEPNHAALAVLAGMPKTVDGPGEYEIAGVMIQGVATRGGQQKAAGASRNTAYSIRIDDLVVCHLGDLGSTLTAEQVEALKDPDVLLVPVGGHCTINAAEAAEVIAQLEPRIVVPMHYRTPAVNLPLESLDRFCSEMAVTEAQPQPRLVVNRSNIPEETTVVVLDYRR